MYTCRNFLRDDGFSSTGTPTACGLLLCPDSETIVTDISCLLCRQEAYINKVVHPAVNQLLLEYVHGNLKRNPLRVRPCPRAELLSE